MNLRDVVDLLSLPEEELRLRAYRVYEQYYRNKVFLRYVVEVSNICHKNCYYCGLRKDNHKLKRYQIPVEEVVRLTRLAYQKGCRSIVIQSGEREDQAFVAYTSEIIRGIKDEFSDMNIVLSCGEQEEATYRLWRELGADRYLLRIELSSPELYSRFHPKDHEHDFYRRRDCLSTLRSLGYQVGTGTLIGLPGTSLEDLARDILFFLEMDVDMLGFGPYVPHPDTPLYQSLSDYDPNRAVDWTLRAIAVCRILMPTVNIASTTALDALRPGARLEGFKWGANVLMPTLTPKEFLSEYQIYSGKAEVKADYCIEALGERIVYNDPGDPLHYLLRQ